MCDPAQLDPVLRDGVPSRHPSDEAATAQLRLRVVRRRTATTVVEARGELDLTTRSTFADALTGAITASPGQHVVVDLTRCTFFAACGVEVLHRARGTARWRRTSLKVVVGGPAATTIARTVRLGAGLRPHHSLRAAEAVRGGRTRRRPPHRTDPSRRSAVPDVDPFDQVIAALERLAQGRFARCDVCGDEIDAGRLAVAADADRCVRHPATRPPQLH